MQGHPQLILAIQEDTILLPGAHPILLDMTEALLLLMTEAQALLTTGQQFPEIILALLLHPTTEVPAHLTIIQDLLADLIITIHLLTALQADQVLVIQEVAVLVLRVEAREDPQEEVATPEVPEEEGGINSPLFFA